MRLLKPETVRMMTTNRLTDAERAFHGAAILDRSALAAKVVGALSAQALAVQDQVRGLERELMAWYRAANDP